MKQKRVWLNADKKMRYAMSIDIKEEKKWNVNNLNWCLGLTKQNESKLKRIHTE